MQLGGGFGETQILSHGYEIAQVPQFHLGAQPYPAGISLRTKKYWLAREPAAHDEHLPGVVITASVKTTGKTGVEMEALTAVSVAALTVYDMAKAAEKTMRIHNIRLLEKHGGRSGDIINE